MKSKQLLMQLGIAHYTERHLRIIDKFLSDEETDCKKLLDELGSWDEFDLAITEQWLNKINEKIK